MIGCKGGWCNSRNNCSHYIDAVRKAEDPDRLCGREEEPEAPIERRMVGVGQWERKNAATGLLARAGAFDGLMPA